MDCDPQDSLLSRVLEPEYMDTEQEAMDYDTMDHTGVNQQFVTDLLAAAQPEPLGNDILDLGTGTALIPVELCEQAADCRILAVDAAVSMLELARYNIEVAGAIDRIQLAQEDAKQLPFDDDYFDVVISNSIVHHIPEPLVVLQEAVRVLRPGGLIFIRDLMRPRDQEQLTALVQEYAGNDNPRQRKLFDDSLHAALTLREMRELVQQVGGQAAMVKASSDRHWTWAQRLGAQPQP